MFHRLPGLFVPSRSAPRLSRIAPVASFSSVPSVGSCRALLEPREVLAADPRLVGEGLLGKLAVLAYRRLSFIAVRLIGLIVTYRSQLCQRVPRQGQNLLASTRFAVAGDGARRRGAAGDIPRLRHLPMSMARGQVYGQATRLIVPVNPPTGMNWPLTNVPTVASGIVICTGPLRGSPGCPACPPRMNAFLAKAGLPRWVIRISPTGVRLARYAVADTACRGVKGLTRPRCPKEYRP